MGYYIRVLSTSTDCVPLSTLKASLERARLAGTIGCEDGDERNWEQVVLSHADGREIAAIERNLVAEGSLGAEELAELAEEIEDCKPATAAAWLKSYFPRVKCIYAFQLLSGKDHKNGWDILAAVKNAIWSFAPSILQADHEGFTNEDGYHILWQFSDGVKAKWWMGVLADGKWKHFEMDLGNAEQREAFLEGRVPSGAKLA